MADATVRSLLPSVAHQFGSASRSGPRSTVSVMSEVELAKLRRSSQSPERPVGTRVFTVLR